MNDDHAGVLAGERPQVRLVVGIWQEPDVDQQVRVARGAVLEPEALERDREPSGGPGRQHLVCELSPQHRRGQARRVDHDVGALAQPGQQRALARNAVGDAAARRQRMAPARLLVARQQRLLVGLEEQDPVKDAQLAQIVEDRGEALEVAAAAHVRDDRRALHLGPLVHEQLDQRADHLRWEIVDAEVARVLERGHRRRLAGTRKAGDHDEIGQRGGDRPLVACLRLQRRLLRGLHA